MSKGYSEYLSSSVTFYFKFQGMVLHNLDLTDSLAIQCALEIPSIHILRARITDQLPCLSGINMGTEDLTSVPQIYMVSALHATLSL